MTAHQRLPCGRPPGPRGGNGGERGGGDGEIEDDAGHGLGPRQPPHAHLGHGGEERGGHAHQRHRLDQPFPRPQDHDQADESHQDRRPQLSRELLAQPGALHERHEEGQRVVQEHRVRQPHVGERVEEAIHRRDPGQAADGVLAQVSRAQVHAQDERQQGHQAGRAAEEDHDHVGQGGGGHLHRHAHQREQQRGSDHVNGPPAKVVLVGHEPQMISYERGLPRSQGITPATSGTLFDAFVSKPVCLPSTSEASSPECGIARQDASSAG